MFRCDVRLDGSSGRPRNIRHHPSIWVVKQLFWLLEFLLFLVYIIYLFHYSIFRSLKGMEDELQCVWDLLLTCRSWLIFARTFRPFPPLPPPPPPPSPPFISFSPSDSFLPTVLPPPSLSVYNQSLYVPLVEALRTCCHERSIIFLGLTRLFSKPHFFTLLLEGKYWPVYRTCRYSTRTVFIVLFFGKLISSGFSFLFCL